MRRSSMAESPVSGGSPAGSQTPTHNLGLPEPKSPLRRVSTLAVSQSTASASASSQHRSSVTSSASSDAGSVKGTSITPTAFLAVVLGDLSSIPPGAGDSSASTAADTASEDWLITRLRSSLAHRSNNVPQLRVDTAAMRLLSRLLSHPNARLVKRVLSSITAEDGVTVAVSTATVLLRLHGTRLIAQQTQQQILQSASNNIDKSESNNSLNNPSFIAVSPPTDSTSASDSLPPSIDTTTQPPSPTERAELSFVEATVGLLLNLSGTLVPGQISVGPAGVMTSAVRTQIRFLQVACGFLLRLIQLHIDLSRNSRQPLLSLFSSSHPDLLSRAVVSLAHVLASLQSISSSFSSAQGAAASSSPGASADQSGHNRRTSLFVGGPATPNALSVTPKNGIAGTLSPADGTLWIRRQSTRPFAPVATRVQSDTVAVTADRPSSSSSFGRSQSGEAINISTSNEIDLELMNLLKQRGLSYIGELQRLLMIDGTDETTVVRQLAKRLLSGPIHPSSPTHGAGGGSLSDHSPHHSQQNSKLLKSLYQFHERFSAAHSMSVGSSSPVLPPSMALSRRQSSMGASPGPAGSNSPPPHSPKSDGIASLASKIGGSSSVDTESLSPHSRRAVSARERRSQLRVVTDKDLPPVAERPDLPSPLLPRNVLPTSSASEEPNAKRSSGEMETSSKAADVAAAVEFGKKFSPWSRVDLRRTLTRSQQEGSPDPSAGTSSSSASTQLPAAEVKRAANASPTKAMLMTTDRIDEHDSEDPASPYIQRRPRNSDLPPNRLRASHSNGALLPSSTSTNNALPHSRSNARVSPTHGLMGSTNGPSSDSLNSLSSVGENDDTSALTVEERWQRVLALVREEHQQLVTVHLEAVAAAEAQGITDPRLLPASPLSARDLFVRHPEVRELISQGIPQSLRGIVWLILSGGFEKSKQFPVDYYERLVAAYTRYGSPYAYEIRQDLHRTLPGVPFFQTMEGQQMLERVLGAYSVMDPDVVGYCQSMNVLCGALLVMLNHEEEQVFWLLAAIVSQRTGYYTKTMCSLMVDQRVLEDLFSFTLPTLKDHLSRMEVSLSMFTVSWFLCMFLEAPIPIAQCALFWDQLFFHGDEMLFQMALSIVHQHQSEIRKLNNIGDVLDYCLHEGIRSDLDVQKLLDGILQRVGQGLQQQITHLRAFHQQQVLLENRTVESSFAQSLVKRYKFKDENDIQRLWAHFLSPSPWHILETSSIPSVMSFHQAFTPYVFTADHRRKWRERGIFSGVIHRLFQLLDRHDSGRVTLTDFIRGVALFLHNRIEDRQKFCFDFFDLDGSGVVERSEIERVFQMFFEMYNGLQIDYFSSTPQPDPSRSDALATPTVQGSEPSASPAPSTSPVPTISTTSTSSTAVQQGAATLAAATVQKSSSDLFTEMVFSKVNIPPSQVEFAFNAQFVQLVSVNPFVRVFFRLGPDAELEKLVEVI